MFKVSARYGLRLSVPGLALLSVLAAPHADAVLAASTQDSPPRLEATTAASRDAGKSQLRAGDYADVRFQITGADDDEPVQGNFPGVWMDLAKAWAGRGTGSMACKDRVALYLQGTVGMRPLVDLNSYFILVMNRSPSISVIDPFVGITGITSLFGAINLTHVPADWVKTRDERRLFVSMSLAGQVAVVELQHFKVATVTTAP